MSIESHDATVEAGGVRADPGVEDKTTPLYIVCSPSRCVGKTLVSRLLAEFYTLDDRPVATFDLADEGPQLADYLPDVTEIADIGDTGGQMAFFDRLIAEHDGATIIDVSHRAFEDFFTVVHKIGFFEEARRRRIEPLILYLVDPDPKSAKAYATLRHWFKDASLLRVRNQIEAGQPRDRDAPPAALEIPPLAFSLRALIDRQSFSFSGYWHATPPDPPDALEDELRDWVEHVFLQLRDLELSFSGDESSTSIAATISRRRQAIDRRRQQHARPQGGAARQGADPAAGGQDPTPALVLQFASKQKKQRIEGDPMDDAGSAIVAMLQEASGLARQLRAAEDRIDQLETEIEHAQDRAVRAETWLQLIQKEIEDRLIAPAAAGPKSMS